MEAAIENHQWSVVRAVLDFIDTPSRANRVVQREIAIAICIACEEGVEGNHRHASQVLHKLLCQQPSLVEDEELMSIADQLELWAQEWREDFRTEGWKRAKAQRNKGNTTEEHLPGLEPSNKRLKKAD